MCSRPLDSVAEEMLIIADRGFLSYQAWSDYLESGADLLFRAWSRMKVLADGTWIAEICKKSAQGGKTRIRSTRLETDGWRLISR